MSNRSLSHKIVVLCALIVLSASSVILSQTNRSPNPNPPFGTLSGRVMSPGLIPIEGVEVSIPRRGVTTITNSNGEFVFQNLALSPDQRLSVEVNAPYYMKTTRIYAVYRERLVAIGPDVIVIWPRAAMVTMDASLGGKLTFTGGAITFPPNALVDEMGIPAQGMVKVAFTTLDVTDPDQLRVVPGDFTARMQNNTVRTLESFGVFEVIAETLQGQRLNLAPGITAAVALDIPAARRRTAPAVIGLFSFDPLAGMWIEEGQLVRNLRNVSYNGTITRFDYSWNADDPLETTCITLEVVNPGGAPFTPAPLGTKVTATGVNYSSISTGYTDANGFVCLLVKTSELVTLQAYHPYINYIQSMPFDITSSSTPSTAADCGTALCPLVATIHLDIIVGMRSGWWKIQEGSISASPPVGGFKQSQ